MKTLALQKKVCCNLREKEVWEGVSGIGKVNNMSFVKFITTFLLELTLP